MVIKQNYYFSPAGEDRRLHIYLPDNYERSQERYPVLYMFDGHNLYYDQDATFGKSLGLKEFLDHWHKNLIVVGIECSSDDWQRVQEYCPYPIFSRIYGQILPRGDETLRWMTEDLKPHIDRNLRTWPSREATAIAGYSMGGVLALYGVLRYNAYFSKAAVISPSLLPSMNFFRKELEQGSFLADTRVFLSWGTAEYDNDTNWFTAQNILLLEGLMQKHGMKTYHYAQKGGQHNEASWEKQVPVWMNFHWF